MAALPAITVDSLGTALAGIPPLRRDPGTPADKVQALRWLTIAQRDPPGQWTDDAWQQANSFTNAVYIAVNTIMTALSGATVVVSERRPGVQRKSHSATGHDESDWTPLDPDHEIARLFADPNAVQTAGDFLAEYELCRSLFGEGIVYAVPGRDSKPAELWNLRKNYLTSITGVSPTYPSGAYRYMMPQPMLWSMTAGLALNRSRLRSISPERTPSRRAPED
jgi:phage portal protein BeeE